MKKYQAILFDLDGTLLPMDNDAFTRGYFGLLAKKVIPYGYDKEGLIPAIWNGVAAMVKNDGSRKNCQAFWTYFESVYGKKAYEDLPVFDHFYSHEFQEAIAFTGPNPFAKRAVELAYEKAEKVILATNPLFPPAGVATRLGWIGLKPEDFDYVTNYENSSFCKPNPKYYDEILEKMELRAEQCLMIGNDAQEDAEAAGAAGLDTFLVTDCLICRSGEITCQKGSFEELLTFLKSL